MAFNLTRTWLICYDIRDKRRLGRIHRYIKKHAIPVQYSVYLTQANQKEINKIHNELNGMIDKNADDIRIYPIPKNPDITLFGQGILTKGCGLIDTQQGSALRQLQAIN